jgi:5'(3')-deoxyribonucleotidase
MRIDEVTDTDVNKMVFLFGELLKICKEELDFEKLPRINWVSDGSYGTKFHSFGSFQPDAGIVTVSITGRHIIDMMRTLAHELVHYKQMLDGRLTPNAGETGSPIENEANAMAGVIMRKFDHKYPEAFSIKPIMEDVRFKLNRLLAEGPPQITPVDAAKTVAGIAGRKIPVVGLGLKAIDAAQDVQQGKPVSALWNLASGAASMVPGPGTAISAGMDMAKGAYDAVAGNNTPAPAPAAPKAAAPKAAPKSVPLPPPRPAELNTPPEPAPAPQQVAAEPRTDAETLNELLGEGSIEIGHIYGNKNLPKIKEKINPKDKGKVHKGLRISEVVGKGTPEVYVDMDGVLADFFKDWNKMVGVGHWKEIKDPESALDMIRNHPTFWIDLDVLSNAPRLLGAIKKFSGSYYICTSPLGKDPNCEPQKRAWAQKYLSEFPPKEVYVTHNKPQFARQADGTPNILIDDFGKNISSWTAAGGIGIHYENKNVNKAVAELKSAMDLNPVDQSQTTSDQAKLAKPAPEKSKDL